MEAKDIINFRKLSQLLTGSSTKIHSKFIPKEYKKTINDLYTVIDFWIEGKIVVSEDEINTILNDFLIFTKKKLKERG